MPNLVIVANIIGSVLPQDDGGGSSIVIIVAIAVVVLILIGGLVYIGLRNQSDEDPLQQRLAEYSEREELPTSLEELELSLSFKDRVIIPLFEAIANLALKFTPERQLEETRDLIRMAGPTYKQTPEGFWAQRIGLTVVLGVGMFIVMGIVAKQDAQNVLLFSAGGAALGFFLPQLQLKSTISKRQNVIQRALPDALDLLTICVEAGLGFDGAMGKVYEKWDNDLSLALGAYCKRFSLASCAVKPLRTWLPVCR